MTTRSDQGSATTLREHHQVVRAPLYRQLAELLRAQLRAGRYPPGQALPSAGALVAEHRISRPTVRQALALLAAEGWIEVVNGKGNYALPAPRGEQDVARWQSAP
jgi:DNA-binding GntR family transcriptional regulator